MKKLISLIMMACMLVMFTSCNNDNKVVDNEDYDGDAYLEEEEYEEESKITPSEYWIGTFYNVLSENHQLMFEIFENEAGDGINITYREVEESLETGNSASQHTVPVRLTDEVTATDDEYSFTINGDELVVEYISSAEMFGTDFTGKYTRGLPYEGQSSFGTDFTYEEPEYEVGDGGILLGAYYTGEINGNRVSVLFHGESGMTINITDQGDKTICKYKVDGTSLIIYDDWDGWDEGDFWLESIAGSAEITFEIEGGKTLTSDQWGSLTLSEGD